MQRKGGIWRPSWGADQRKRRYFTKPQLQQPGKTTREFRAFQVGRLFRPLWPYYRRQRKRVGLIKQEQPQKSGRTTRAFARFRISAFRPPWQMFWRYGLRRRRVGFISQEQPGKPWRISREIFRSHLAPFRLPWPYHRRQRKRPGIGPIPASPQLPGKTARIFARLRITFFRKAFFPRQRLRRTFARISQVQSSGKTAREMAFWKTRKFRVSFFPRQRKRVGLIASEQPGLPVPRLSRPSIRLRISLFRKQFFPRQRARRTFARISQPALPWKPLIGLRWRLRRKLFRPSQRHHLAPVIVSVSSLPWKPLFGLRWWKLKRKLFRPLQKRRNAMPAAPVLQLPKPVRRSFFANLLRHWKPWRPRPLRKALSFLVPVPPPPPSLPLPPTGAVLAVDAAYGSSVVVRSTQNQATVQPVHVGDVGTTILFAVGELRLPPKPSLQLLFTRPDGSTLAVLSPSVFVGTLEANTYLGSFISKTYVSYVFQPGDISLPGIWRAVLVANGVVVSQLGQFNVLA